MCGVPAEFQMNGRRSRGVASEVVKVLKPLRDSPAGRLEVRVVDLRGERRLDIRQFVQGETFSRFTRKGVCLSAEEFEALLEQQGAIAAALEGRAGRGEPQSRRWRPRRRQREQSRQAAALARVSRPARVPR